MTTHAEITASPAPEWTRSPELLLNADWAEVFSEPERSALAKALQNWLPSRRWFRGKARTVRSIQIREQIPVAMGRQKAFLVIFQVNYTAEEPESYVLPLAYAAGRQSEAIARQWPQMVLARAAVNRPRQSGVLYDAIVDKDFCRALLALTARKHRVQGRTGQLEAEPTAVLHRIERDQGLDIEPSVGKAEQSNSSVIYDGTIILKFFRRLDSGVNPELEIERFLAARSFPHSPALAGSLEYHEGNGQTATVAVLTSFIPGCHDAWEDTLESLKDFYRKVRKLPDELRLAPPAPAASGSIFGQSTPAQRPVDLIGADLGDARILGRRTAALHLALASDAEDPAFRPEPWTPPAQQALADSLQDLTRRNFELLRRRLPDLPSDVQALGARVVSMEPAIAQRFKRLAQQPVAAVRIRTHGDYHLGQVLHHGSDFLIIDFEGEPALSLEDRREKQSAIRDVSGMIYSFFYAANAGLRELRPGRLSIGPAETAAAWARYWAIWVGTTFVRAYLETARSAPFIPADEAALKVMLDVELLRKAIYELGYELNNRPDWLNISLQVLIDLLNPENPI
jgi:maltose alpha-D-glucosyltransferase/alpha-amylase